MIEVLDVPESGGGGEHVCAGVARPRLSEHSAPSESPVRVSSAGGEGRSFCCRTLRQSTSRCGHLPAFYRVIQVTLVVRPFALRIKTKQK